MEEFDPNVIKALSLSAAELNPIVASTRFEIMLRSCPEGNVQPFPEASWNESELRWEWSCGLVSTLLSLAKALGHPLLIHPAATVEGDLDVLEIADCGECGEEH